MESSFHTRQQKNFCRISELANWRSIAVAAAAVADQGDWQANWLQEMAVVVVVATFSFPFLHFLVLKKRGRKEWMRSLQDANRFSLQGRKVATAAAVYFRLPGVLPPPKGQDSQLIPHHHHIPSMCLINRLIKHQAKKKRGKKAAFAVTKTQQQHGLRWHAEHCRSHLQLVHPTADVLPLHE